MRLRKLFRLLTSKFLLVCLVLLIELALVPAAYYFILFNASAGVFVALLIAVVVFDFILVLFIVNADINAEYKIAWLVPILFIPPAGGFLFLSLRRRKTPRRQLKILRDKFDGMEEAFYRQDEGVTRKYEQAGVFAAQCASATRAANFLPPADCCDAEYFPSGEAYAARLTEELEKAEKFIFLEYFIIARGKFWDGIVEILERKAAAGVEVRVIYDDIGSMFKVPSNYPSELEKMGIHCLCFNRFRPVLDVAQNNRTHRKIAVIDGLTAFTGGINLADEYINEEHPFGHWKDTGVLVRGHAAQNFTAMFLQLWSLYADKEDYSAFTVEAPEGDCLCLPFCDSPFDENNVCENLYLKIVYNAKKYVYIFTPYLILDGEMKRALVSAARAGVDVRIVVPGIPDKKYVYAVTKAFYSQLVKDGIKIYRYTPGFIHAKSIVSDGNCCIVGSSNMDFRSFYLHFECDAAFFDERIAGEVEQDFLATCQVSELVTVDAIKDSVPRLLYRALLRIFAPLM